MRPVEQHAARSRIRPQDRREQFAEAATDVDDRARSPKKRTRARCLLRRDA